MRRRKPDLLFVLAVILGCGIAMTSYGSSMVNAQVLSKNTHLWTSAP